MTDHQSVEGRSISGKAGLDGRALLEAGRVARIDVGIDERAGHGEARKSGFGLGKHRGFSQQFKRGLEGA